MTEKENATLELLQRGLTVALSKIALPQEEHWLTFSVSEIRDVNAEGVNSESQ